MKFEDTVFGIIYKATCRMTGLSYIGLTIQDLNRRMVEHKSNAKYYTKNTQKFYLAIKKYDIDSFEFDIVDYVDYETGVEGIQLDEVRRCAIKLRQLERDYIEEFNTFENGYNNTRGGEGTFRCEMLTPKEKELRKRIRNKKHYHENKEQYAKNSKIWREGNKDYCVEYGKLWYEKNIEKTKLYYEANKEYIKKKRRQKLTDESATEKEIRLSIRRAKRKANKEKIN